MTYQRFSALVVSVVISVIIWPLPCDERDDVLEHGVPERDVDPDHEADREDQHGQVPDMLARRPRDLAELGPDFVEIAADATQFVSLCSCPDLRRTEATLCEPSVRGCGRGDRTRTYNRWFWRPVLCQLSYTPVATGLGLPTSPRGEVYAVGSADSISAIRCGSD